MPICRRGTHVEGVCDVLLCSGWNGCGSVEFAERCADANVGREISGGAGVEGGSAAMLGSRAIPISRWKWSHSLCICSSCAVAGQPWNRGIEVGELLELASKEVVRRSGPGLDRFAGRQPLLGEFEGLGELDVDGRRSVDGSERGEG